MESIDFTEYDRITDTLLYFNDDCVLNFTVALSRKSRTGERIFYHYESMYGSDKYGGKLRSIKRYMNFYFVIDIKSDFNKGFIIRPQDAEMLTRLIEAKVLPWYFGNQNQVAFQIINDKLALTSYEPVIYTQAGLYDTKYLSFEPVVLSENDLDIRGVRMDLSTGYSFTITIDKFMGFFRLLNSDMYTAATGLLTYAKSEPYGINSHTLQGLGAPPPSSAGSWNNLSFNNNSFLNNSKSKRDE